MAFLETPRFPVDIKYGSIGGPSFNTDIVTTGNGIEFRQQNWSLPRFRYDAQYMVKTRALAQAIYDLFLVSKGKANGFRVKDLFDYTTAANGITAPAQTDQTIGPGID